MTTPEFKKPGIGEALNPISKLKKIGQIGEQQSHRHETIEGKKKTHEHKGGNKAHTHPNMPKYLGIASAARKIGRSARKLALGFTEDIMEQGVPSNEYIENVHSAVLDDSNKTDKDSQEAATVLAYSCWRHDWPLAKDFFESDVIEFSEPDVAALNEFTERLETFEEIDNKSDDSEDEEYTTLYDENGDESWYGPLSAIRGAFGQDKENVKSDNEEAKSRKGGKQALHRHKKSNGDQITHRHEDPDGSKSHSHKDKGLTGYEKASQARRAAHGASRALYKENPMLLDEYGNQIIDHTDNFSEEDRMALNEWKLTSKILDYTEQVEGLVVIPGTVKDKATKLANLEINMGEEAAKERLAEWKQLNSAIDSAGVTKTLLATYSEGTGDARPDGDATAKVKKYAEDNKVTEKQALAQLSAGDATLFKSYYTENSAS